MPYRSSGSGIDAAVSVLLVTSRETKRWVIPKGWPMKGKKPHRAAEREAYEEAGVVGEVGHEPVGHYSYHKRLDDGSSLPCDVAVFALEVTGQRQRWPEMKEREAHWFTPEEAAQAVEEESLSELLIGFGQATSTRHAAQQQRLKLRALWDPPGDGG